MCVCKFSTQSPNYISKVLVGFSDPMVVIVTEKPLKEHIMGEHSFTLPQAATATSCCFGYERNISWKLSDLSVVFTLQIEDTVKSPGHALRVEMLLSEGRVSTMSSC